jgi:protein-S-isoprenylcysteine O-methyltransferase Ste14
MFLSQELEMETSSNKFLAYFIVSLALLFGGGSLILLLLFFLGVLPPFLNLHLSENQLLWWDACLCLAFFVQHSGMVRRSFRRRLASYIEVEYEGAIYAIASGMVLVVMILLWQKSSQPIMLFHGILRWLFFLGFLLSVAGFAWGTRALRRFDPFGLRPILGHLRNKSLKRMPLIVQGPYRWVRHPLYLFMIIMIWSCPAPAMDRLLFNVFWTVWIFVGSMLEERDLVIEFGDEYREY